MAASYFFTVNDFEKNPIPSLSGTWSLYVSENRTFVYSELTFATQSTFTTDGSGGVSYIDGIGNPITVPLESGIFFLLLESDGYKNNYFNGDFGKNPYSVDQGNWNVSLFTDTQWIDSKIKSLQDEFVNRFGQA